MNFVTTIIRDTASELSKFANYLDKELPICEIKGFFLVRHYKVPFALITLQRDIIRDWEPRISSKIDGLNAREYDKLRSWLGIDKSSSLSQQEFHNIGSFKRFPHEEANHLFRKRI